MVNNIASWLFSGGSVSIPKRLLAFSDILGLDFESIGQLIYLLYLEGEVVDKDKVGINAAIELSNKELVDFDRENGSVDFSPLFSKLAVFTGISDEKPKTALSTTDILTNLIKKIEKTQGTFLSPKEKLEISQTIERYGWSEALIYESFIYYKKLKDKTYTFSFFVKLANGAGVKNLETLKEYIKTLNYEQTKVREVLRRIGKYNNPTVAQEEMYYKWSREWQFTHDMIILASDKTVGADKPSFIYIDVILADWYDKGIKTKQDLNKYLGHKKNIKTTYRKKPTISNGYKGPERDLSDLEE